MKGLLPFCLVLFLLAGCGPQETFPVEGVFTLSDGISAVKQGGPCHGTSGYDDIRDGTEVVIRNADDKTVAIGHLAHSGADMDGFVAIDCVFLFDIPKVPSGQGPYSVEVSHRSEIHFTEDNPVLQLELGGDN